MATGTYNSTSILGDYQQSVSAAMGGGDRVVSDKDTFLKLLIAQLTHQDPLNPTEDKEFIAQLAQFTTVEELQKVNEGIESLNASQSQQQVINAASLMNMHITAKGDLVTKADDYMSSLYTTLSEPVESITINVYATNPDGSVSRLVRSHALGARQAGEFSYMWDGKDNDGREAQNGLYSIAMSAKRKDGSSVLVETSSSGVVIGVKTSPDGNHNLYLHDGRSVLFNNVEIISYPASGSGEDTSGTAVLTKDGAKVSTLVATLGENATSSEVKVYSTDDDGSVDQLVYSESLGAKEKGEFSYDWNGKNNSGEDLPDGKYIINISGVNSAGKNIAITTRVE